MKYGLLEECEPYSAIVAGWDIRETYEAGVFDHVQKGLGSYRITIERDLADLDALPEANWSAETLIEHLDTAWCYVLGEPMVATHLTLSLWEPPNGWTTNSETVRRELIRESAPGFHAEVQQLYHYHSVRAPFLPLERLLQVRDAYLSATPLIQDLIALHITSYKSVGGALYPLAKALELAGAFHGTSRRDRNCGLQNEIRAMGIEPELTQNVAWLFNIANERFDIRHAVDNRAANVATHPRLTDSERRDFKHNARLLLRAFVCKRLDVPLIPVRRYAPSTE